MNTKHLVILFGSVLLFVLAGCTNEPRNKADYIEKFSEFTASVEEDYKTYSEEAWKKKDEMYEKFSKQWFKEYEDVLEFKEKVELKKMALKYQLYRNGSKLKGGIEAGVDALIEMGQDVLEVLDSVKIEIETKDKLD